MPQKNDRRVRKTRSLLRQALVRLMNEKSIQEITVTQLCEACDINRGTFYLHYTDVYDLLSRIEEEMLTDFENVLGKLVPEEIVFVSESGMKTPEDIAVLRKNGTDAVLIGETLMRSPDKREALEKLRGNV